MGEKQLKGKMIIPALIISRLATTPPGLLTGLLLIDIGLTFEQPVGVMGQIRTSSFLISLARACYIGGSLLAGRLVNSFGRKKLTVFSVTLVGVLTVLYLNVSPLSISLISICVLTVFGGMRATTTNSLILEQIPEARGTLMSLASAATSLGSTFGAAIGGYLLLRYGYSGLGVGMGAVGILGALVFAFLTIEPA